jgi:hypothetical protein
LQIYLDSPAAKALAVAERTFPVLRGSHEIDSAPLMRPIDLRYPFAVEKSKRRFMLLPTLVAGLMFAGALAIVWRGQRKRILSSSL